MKRRTLQLSRTVRASESLESIFPPLLYRQVAAMGLSKVLDLTSVSESQLLALRGVGRLTVHRLREILNSIGLDFREPADPFARARRANDQARRLPMHERIRSADAAAHISVLGMGWQTVRSCLSHDITTVGQLQALRRARIIECFTRRAAVELLACQRDLASAPAGDAVLAARPVARPRSARPARETKADSGRFAQA